MTVNGGRRPDHDVVAYRDRQLQHDGANRRRRGGCAASRRLPRFMTKGRIRTQAAGFGWATARQDAVRLLPVQGPGDPPAGALERFSRLWAGALEGEPPHISCGWHVLDRHQPYIVSHPASCRARPPGVAARPVPSRRRPPPRRLTRPIQLLSCVREGDPATSHAATSPPGEGGGRREPRTVVAIPRRLRCPSGAGRLASTPAPVYSMGGSSRHDRGGPCRRNRRPRPGPKRPLPGLAGPPLRPAPAVRRLTTRRSDCGGDQAAASADRTCSSRGPVDLTSRPRRLDVVPARTGAAVLTWLSARGAGREQFSTTARRAPCRAGRPGRSVGPGGGRAVPPPRMLRQTDVTPLFTGDTSPCSVRYGYFGS